MTKWRYFADRELRRVIRQYNLPCTNGRHSHDICPLHQEPVGSFTRICERCFRQAWDEVGRRYATAEQGAGKEPDEHQHRRDDRR